MDILILSHLYGSILLLVLNESEHRYRLYTNWNINAVGHIVHAHSKYIELRNKMYQCIRAGVHTACKFRDVWFCFA